MDLATRVPATAALTVDAAGTDLTYQCRKDGNDLADNGHFYGTGAAQLMIGGTTTIDIGTHDVVVANGCDSMLSDGAFLNVCPADFNCDGFVSGANFDQFVELFVLGDVGADFDHNAFVNGDDVDQFVLAIEAGC